MEHSSDSNFCGTFLNPPSKSQTNLPVTILKTFFIVRGSFTFEQAKSTVCASNGGSFATSRSIEEFDFIPGGIGLETGEKAWINLKRIDQTNDFLWQFNPIVQFLNGTFFPGAANRPGDCVAWEYDNSGKALWQVYQCSEQMNVVCETFTVL